MSDPRPFGRRAADKGPWARTRHAVARIDVWQLLLTALVFWALWLARDANRTTTANAEGARAQVVRIDGLVQTIQEERVSNTRNSCEAQNARNRNTKLELRSRVPGADERRLITTLALIDALAPVRDCDDVVAAQTGKSASEQP